MIQPRTPQQRRTHIQHTHTRPPTHKRRQPTHLIRQRHLRPRRHHPRHHTNTTNSTNSTRRLHLRNRHHPTRRNRRLLQHHMRIRPADTEPGHRRPTRTTRPRPLTLTHQQLHRTRRPIHLRRRLLHMQRPRQDAVLEGEHGLDHARDACGSLRVADVGLQRTQIQRVPVRAVLAIGGQQGLRLDRVTQRGTGTVRLHRVDLGGGQAGVGEGLADDALLRGTVGGAQSVGRTVLVGGGATDDGEYRVPVAVGVREALQEDHSDALGEADALGVAGEGAAAAVVRQASLAAEADEALRGRHDGHSAGEGHVALALLHCLGGEVQRGQR
ncbi:hypothetical protein Sgri01_07199 [Streptomyces griseus]